MSRAQYIWIVVARNGLPIAAFTVKHELSWWLDRVHDGEPINVCRIKDSRHHPGARPLWLNPHTLEPLIDQEGDGMPRYAE